jgi:periplasmic protein TonB
LIEEKAMRLLSPFSLENATLLPVTGELHPLRREFSRWMSLGNGLTLMLALAIVGLCWALRHPTANPNVESIHVVVDIGPPPSIVHTPSRTAINLAPSAPVKLGIVEPVPIVDPQSIPFPTVDEWKHSLDAMSTEALSGTDVVVVQEPTALPGPDVLVVCEEYPRLLRLDPPIYPGLAREAGLEGKVLLRVLVGTDGRVVKCLLLSGNPMLADAAMASARSALFAPATQQHKPVAVWVQLPIEFSLK